jgi:hypothetical protein
MRYQQKIYIQNNNSALRNRNNVNVNMSSDICVFNAPLFNVNGATKINCTGSTSGGTYITTSTSTIPLTFEFTGNTDSFSATSASFKYEIYKYSDSISSFDKTPVYKSNIINYSAFSGTNTTLENIPVSGLSLDGEYLIKGYYDFDVCTNFLNKLGKKINTLAYKNGSEYGLYNSNVDYYFSAIQQPDSPNFLLNNSNNYPDNTLRQQTIVLSFPEPEYDDNDNLIPATPYRTFAISDYSGNFVITLNGLTLSPDADYTFSGTLITLNSDILPDDIITVIYTTNGQGNSLITDNIFIYNPIISGNTSNEGSNRYYFNTNSNKFELFTSVETNDSNSIIVMINGVTLANEIDFYQSTSNKKRLILEGDLVIGDIITIAYYPQVAIINGVIEANPLVSFSIASPPQKINGLFTLETSDSKSFNNIIFTATTNYSVGVTAYGIPLNISGNVGTQLYYRIKNEKNYITFCGNSISAVTYSDIIPITIQINSINSY